MSNTLGIPDENITWNYGEKLRPNIVPTKTVITEAKTKEKCPTCKKSFVNLPNHMRFKHPSQYKELQNE